MAQTISRNPLPDTELMKSFFEYALNKEIAPTVTVDLRSAINSRTNKVKELEKLKTDIIEYQSRDEGNLSQSQELLQSVENEIMDNKIRIEEDLERICKERKEEIIRVINEKGACSITDNSHIVYVIKEGGDYVIYDSTNNWDFTVEEDGKIFDPLPENILRKQFIRQYDGISCSICTFFTDKFFSDLQQNNSHITHSEVLPMSKTFVKAAQILYEKVYKYPELKDLKEYLSSMLYKFETNEVMESKLNSLPEYKAFKEALENQLAMYNYDYTNSTLSKTSADILKNITTDDAKQEVEVLEQYKNDLTKKQIKINKELEKLNSVNAPIIRKIDIQNLKLEIETLDSKIKSLSGEEKDGIKNQKKILEAELEQLIEIDNKDKKFKLPQLPNIVTNELPNTNKTKDVKKELPNTNKKEKNGFTLSEIPPFKKVNFENLNQGNKLKTSNLVLPTIITTHQYNTSKDNTSQAKTPQAKTPGK